MAEPKSNRRGAALKAERMGLPIRPFLYTLDQIATLLSMSVVNLSNQYVYFERRSTGARSVHLILARNIAKPDDKPDWRIAEEEFIRWLKVKGFRLYDVGGVRL